MNGSLEIALSGMRAAQVGLDVTSHNVANVSTEGYTRQRVVQSANMSLLTNTGLAGAGVSITSITRVTDRFVARQIRAHVGEQGFYDQLSSRLGEVEAVLNESLGDNLGDAFNDFFSSLSQVVANPEDRGTRVTAINSAQLLATKLRSTDDRLKSIQSENRRELRYAVDDFNTTLDRLAAVNGKIASGALVDKNVTDLQDERDRLLENLSRQMDAQIHVDQNDGQASVAINGHSVLLGCSAVHLTVDSSGIYAEGSTTRLPVDSGRIGALLELRDNVLPDYADQINTLTATMISEFNAVHRANQGIDSASTTGLDLFTGTDADDIAVNAAIVSDPLKLATSAGGAPGDSGGVKALLALREQPLINGSTLEAYHQGIVGEIGSEAGSAADHDTSIETVLTQLRNRRDSVNGVSIDEEMANLIRFQQAYNAAARIITVCDELYQAVLNVGR